MEFVVLSFPIFTSRVSCGFMLWYKANDPELEKLYREIYASISQFDVNLNKLTEAKNKSKDFRQILDKLLAKIRLNILFLLPWHIQFVQQIWTKSFANGHKRDGHIFQYQSSQLD